MEEQLYRIRRHNFGKCYSTYEDFVNAYAPDLINYFHPGYGPKHEKQRYTIVKVARHLSGLYQLAILKEVNQNKIIIMDYYAIEETDY